MARILVIDDDQSLLQMMSLMLARAGHTPLLASHAADGIQMARDQVPDVAIVDLMMPEMSGFEVCRTLRLDPQTSHIPLLVLTALSHEDPRETAIKSGADDFATKPITKDGLIRRVEDLLATGARNMPAMEEELKLVDDRAGVLPDTVRAKQRAESRAKLPIIAVLGLGNGVGTTTLTINLALATSQAGRPCIVDLHDFDGQVALQLKLAPPRSTWEKLADIKPGAPKKRIGEALLLNHASGAAVLAAPIDSSHDTFSPDGLYYVFDVLREGFRWTVVDMPMTVDMDEATKAVLYYAEYIILAAGDNPTSLMAAQEVLKDVDEMNLPGEQYMVVNRTRPQGIPLEEIMQAFNRPIAATFPYEQSQFQALRTGQPLLMSEPNSLFTRTAIQLARQF